MFVSAGYVECDTYCNDCVVGPFSWTLVRVNPREHCHLDTWPYKITDGVYDIAVPLGWGLRSDEFSHLFLSAHLADRHRRGPGLSKVNWAIRGHAISQRPVWNRFC